MAELKTSELKASEPTISEIIEIHSGYTNAVDLGLELYDDNRNVGRMSRYRPITSHRQAFQKLAQSVKVKDKRCYLLTGAYGTGKSHLCLMFANYLQTPAGETPMPEFFKHYAEVDATDAEDLRMKRSKGHYLVALCDWGGKEDFEEIVLRAVDSALRRVGFDDDFDTIYLQAIEKIQQWETYVQEGDSRARLFEDFECELTEANAGMTVAQFKKRLKDFDYEMLAEFRRLHEKVTTAPFNYEKSSLLNILTGTLRSEKFKERFLGILVLFDEFGDTMERGKLSTKAFQQFAQLCADTPADCARLVFVATAHKSLTSYAKSYNADSLKTASDRIDEVPLTPDGVEDIIAAIISPQKQNPLWKQYVEPRSQTFDSFVPELNTLKNSHRVFDWLNTPKLRTKIIENIYPMHPMATYCLLQLTKDVASNNRSVFSFFSADIESGGAPDSYTDYIRQTPIVTDNRLNLYTPDRLFDYFAETLNSDNKELRDTVRDQIKDYENSVRELNKVVSTDFGAELFKDDPLITRLMRLMLVYGIVGIHNRADNIRFGLYCSKPEEDALKNRVASLVAKGILYQHKDTGILEFKKATAKDLDRMIEAFVQNPENQPANLVAELSTLVPLDKKNELYLEAKDYNDTYTEDKRLERRIVRPVDLEEETETTHGKRDLFARLEAEIAAEIAKKGEFEGIALYVACETQEEIAKAKSLCGRNKSDRIVVAIPKQPISLLDAILEVKALRWIERSEEKKNFTTQDNAALSSRLNGSGASRGAYAKLQELRDRMLDVKEVSWFGKYAQPQTTDDKKAYDAANRVMDYLYGEKRNKFRHDDFNRLHQKIDKSKVALKEAVEILTNYTEPIVIDTAFAQQRGDIRYLRSCLLNNSALKQVKSEGAKLRCEVEKDPSKFDDKLPALADMVRQVEALGMKGEINIAEWARQYRQPPYGQSSFSLVISLAFLRRMFGDSIRFKIDKNTLGDMPLREFDEVLRLCEGQYPNAVLSYRPLVSAERDLANAVYAVFGKSGSAEAADHSVVEAYNALKNWWESLPALTRAPKLYASDTDTQVSGFIAIMEQIAAKDAHAFLFEDLPTAFGYDSALAITAATVTTLQEQLPPLKIRLDDALSEVERRIISGVGELFEVELSTHDDIRQGIAAWFNSLDSNQKDTHASWQDQESRPLIQYLGTISELADTFLVKIPSTMHYGGYPVQNWVTDRTTEYLKRLRSGKARIDSNRRKVESAKVTSEGDFERQGKTISFHDKVQLILEAPAAGMKIYITEGAADPTDPAASRQLVKTAEPLLIRDNKTIRYAVQDGEGNWSSIETLTLTNADKKYEPTVGDANIFGDRSAHFTFPKDSTSLKITYRELFRKTLELGIVSSEELSQCLETALKEAVDK